MAARDPHRFINELDPSTLPALIERLEGRARNPLFAGLFEKYLDRLDLPRVARILEVGCGTGAMLRVLARRPDFRGECVGIDHSPHFVEAARNYAREERLDGRLHFAVGDAHNLDFPPSSFDLVIAHTMISHVTDPALVLGEMASVARPGGAVVIFDGDYASLTYAYPDHGFGHQMDVALATATFNNPRIMRDIPRFLPRFGLRLASAWGDAVVEIGDGDYFKSFAETYAPYVKRAGVLPAQAVDVWLKEQEMAMAHGTFFAACNYYTYIARRV
ncbi:MAG: methyltransferase domain-containing protein [Betaproteobacteria bacterium]|nr:methyltransferase domain-containing protein [Betaproteobacteria bacterium]